MSGALPVSGSASAFAPASIGNFAVGFDTLGAAVAPLEGPPLGDEVEVAVAEKPSLLCEGPFAHQLPEDPAANLATLAATAFGKAWGRPLPTFRIRLFKGLPVGSGLGSSAATVAATLKALNALFGDPLGEAALLRAAGEAEAHASGAVHLDNVAPALLGGLRLITPDGAASELPFPERLRLVVVSPDLRLATREARAVLPTEVPLPLVVAHARQLATFVHALHAENDAALRGSFRDLIAEPHRAILVPGFREAQAAALGAGAWACTLSGAGPALFAVAELELAGCIGEAMLHAWHRVGVEASARICGLDRQGARTAVEAA